MMFDDTPVDGQKFSQRLPFSCCSPNKGGGAVSRTAKRSRGAARKAKGQVREWLVALSPYAVPAVTLVIF